MTTNGLVAAKATAARPRCRSRGAATFPTPAATSGTRRRTPGYFALAASPTASPAQLDPAGDHQREGDRDTERQRHVRHRHARVRDVGRLDGDGRRGDEPRDRPVRAAAEPPRRRDPGERDRDQDSEPRREVRRFRVPRLERREQVHDQRRVVEPVRVEAARRGSSPRRAGRCSAHPGSGAGREGRSGFRRAGRPRRAPGWHASATQGPPHRLSGLLRPRAGPHEPGRRDSVRRRSPRRPRRARARRSRPAS